MAGGFGMNPFDIEVSYISVSIELIRGALKEGHVAARSNRVNLDGRPIDGTYWVPNTRAVHEAVWYLVVDQHRKYRHVAPYVQEQLLAIRAMHDKRSYDRQLLRSLLEHIEDILSDPATEAKWLDTLK